MEKTIEVTIEGASPLLMNRMPGEVPNGYTKKSAAEQAEISAYRIPDGVDGAGMLYIPSTALQRALINAGLYIKGKGRASLQRDVSACVYVGPEYLSLGLSEYEIDSRSVVIGATKGRIMRHRARVNDWKITFKLTYDTALINSEQIRTLVENCGSRVGLLDFRPQCKGPYGRFHVINWAA